MIVGAPESMSKSKKNTVDPELMINEYGADSIRWFILSDSPPEKDVQWSNTGVTSANKFLQKIWNLNFLVSKRNQKETDKELENKFIINVNNYVSKIDKSIEGFRFNVAIAHFYEIYKLLKYNFELNISNKVFRENIIKVLKLMIPFTPHLAHECLEILACDTAHVWPKIEKNITEKIELAVQINGKTRDIITVKKDLIEVEISKVIINKSKAKKYIENKKITKTIFVKNKIINYIVQN